MAVTHVSAAVGQRTGGLLSADNPPERHIVLALLRQAAPRLGLKPPVLATLDVLLSFLPPKRGHHTVFASNESLVERRNGVSERTIRRHVEQLIECGLIVRRDSPNRKRYTRRNRTDGLCLRFGFDLSPLYERLQEIARIAAEMQALRERLDYMRAKLRAAVQSTLALDPEHPQALSVLALLRRKLSLSDCETLLAGLPQAPVEKPLEDAVETKEMTGGDGQNVRHHQSSKKENIDKTPTIPVQAVLDACPEAQSFSTAPIRSYGEIIHHGRTLAPMLGISPETYAMAEKRCGTLGTALTIWAIVQMQGRIRKLGAYFHSLTLGPRSAGYDPVRLIAALGRERSGDCPRTMV